MLNLFNLAFMGVISPLYRVYKTGNRALECSSAPNIGSTWQSVVYKNIHCAFCKNVQRIWLSSSVIPLCFAAMFNLTSTIPFVEITSKIVYCYFLFEFPIVYVLGNQIHFCSIISSFFHFSRV